MARPHDVDLEVHDAVQSATGFIVSLFLGPGLGYHRSEPIKDSEEHPLKSLADARLGGRILKQRYQSPRLAIVYAITPDGKSVMVPPTYDYASMEDAIMNAQTSTRRIMSGATSLSAMATAIASGKAAADTKITPAPDAGKGATTVDIGDMPVHLRRGTPENADFLSEANAKKGAEAVARKAASLTPTKPGAAAGPVRTIDPKSAEGVKITKATLKAQISAAPSSKASKPKKEKKVRAESPDAVKPIVPRGGAALAEWEKQEAKAAKGQLPPVPDFSAQTHAPYRDRLKEVVTLAKAGDVKGLRANAVRPLWNSQTQIVRYREMAIAALTAKDGKITHVFPDDTRNDKDTRKPGTAASTKTKAPAKAKAKKAGGKPAAKKAAKAKAKKKSAKK